MRMGPQPEFGRFVGEAVAGDGRQHEVERVLGAAAVRGRIGEGADGLEQFDDRARPAVRHDQRQRVLVRRLHVDEVDVQPVDLGLELRQRVQSRFAPAPVVFGRPVAGEFLRRGQLHTLGPIGDEFLGRPTSRIDAAAQFFDLAFRDVDSERADLGLCACARGVTHDRVPSPIASSLTRSTFAPMPKLVQHSGRRCDLRNEMRSISLGAGRNDATSFVRMRVCSSWHRWCSRRRRTRSHGFRHVSRRVSHLRMPRPRISSGKPCRSSAQPAMSRSRL